MTRRISLSNAKKRLKTLQEIINEWEEKQELDLKWGDFIIDEDPIPNPNYRLQYVYNGETQ